MEFGRGVVAEGVAAAATVTGAAGSWFAGAPLTEASWGTAPSVV